MIRSKDEGGDIPTEWRSCLARVESLVLSSRGHRKRKRDETQGETKIDRKFQFEALSGDCVEILDDVTTPLPQSFWKSLNKAISRKPSSSLEFQDLTSELNDTAHQKESKDVQLQLQSQDDENRDQAERVKEEQEQGQEQVVEKEAAEESGEDTENASPSQPEEQDKSQENEEEKREEDIASEDSDSATEPREDQQSILKDTKTREVRKTDSVEEFTAWMTGDTADREKERQDVGSATQQERVHEPQETLEKETRRRDVNSTVQVHDPFTLKRWPQIIRERSFAYKMPPASKRYVGEQIVVWLQLGGIHGTSPREVRTEDNLLLTHALWLHHELHMPLIAICTLPTELDYFVRSNNVQDGSSDADRVQLLTFLNHAFCLMHQELNKLNIPLLGILCRDKDLLSCLSLYTRLRKAHLVLTGESYSPSSVELLQKVARALPCPLYSIDSNCIQPPRYAANFGFAMDGLPLEQLDNDKDLYNKFLERALNTCDAMKQYAKSFSNLKAIPAIQQDLFCNNNNQLSVPPVIARRWSFVDVDKCRKRSASHPCKLLSTRNTVLEKLKAVQDFSLEDSLHSYALAMLRSGILSPLSLYKQLAAANQHTVARKLILEREVWIHSAYHTLVKKKRCGVHDRRDTVIKQKTKLPDSVGTRTRSERKSKNMCRALGDLLRGHSDDETWNILQKRLLENGFLDNEKSVLAFWVQKILEWNFNPADGLALALAWLARYMYGGESADVVASVVYSVENGMHLFRELTAP